MLKYFNKHNFNPFANVLSVTPKTCMRLNKATVAAPTNQYTIDYTVYILCS